MLTRKRKVKGGMCLCVLVCREVRVWSQCSGKCPVTVLRQGPPQPAAAPVPCPSSRPRTRPPAPGSTLHRTRATPIAPGTAWVQRRRRDGRRRRARGPEVAAGARRARCRVPARPALRGTRWGHAPRQRRPSWMWVMRRVRNRRCWPGSRVWCEPAARWRWRRQRGGQRSSVAGRRPRRSRSAQMALGHPAAPRPVRRHH